MNNELGLMVISNPKRRGLGYRLRDASMILATLSLWGLLLMQTYLTVTSIDFQVEQAHVIMALKIIAINFVAVFLAFHIWVVYECVLFRMKSRVMSK